MSTTNSEVSTTQTKVKKPKRPEIRMNLTTKLRLLKANPLVTYQLEQKCSAQSSTKSSLTNLAKSHDISLNTVANGGIGSTTTFAKKSFKKPEPVAKSTLNRTLNGNRVENTQKVTATGKKTVLKSREIQAKYNTINKLQPKQTINKVNSVSSTTQKPKANVELKKQEKTASKQAVADKSAFVVPPSPAAAFKTPTAYRRRSIISNLGSTGRKSSTLISSTTSQTPSNRSLSNNLTKWLAARGKSLGDFHHLKCFGLHGLNKLTDTRPEPSDDENKENIQCTEVDTSSYEDLGIICQDQNNEINHNKVDEVHNLEEVAKAALIDLHNLIMEGYSADQCDIWLDLIQSKCNQVVEEPEYWECRAALEQSRGNIASAVECYKAALMQGAEVHVVDDHLDQLLQKFSLLDIAKESNQKSSNNRDKIINDARNVFKSSIIQFAVQERSLKIKQKKECMSEKKFIATPVRRSTRLSRSFVYTSTPGVKLFNTLEEVDGDIKESLNFKTNKALLN